MTTPTLEAAARGVLTGCREWLDEERDPHRCNRPAEFVLWGKLLPADALGPRCYDHAVKWLGHSVAVRAPQYAVVDLRPLRAALSLVEELVDDRPFLDDLAVLDQPSETLPTEDEELPPPSYDPTA